MSSANDFNMDKAGNLLFSKVNLHNRQQFEFGGLISGHNVVVKNTIFRAFFMGMGSDPGTVSWGKMHQYRGQFFVGYLASLLLIFKHNSDKAT